MADLRKMAKGQPCRVMLDGICNGDPDTTVLAHLRFEFYGMGIKPDDLLAAHSCSACHDAIDGRTHKDLDREYRLLAHLKGFFRTIVYYIDEGILML